MGRTHTAYSRGRTDSIQSVFLLLLLIVAILNARLTLFNFAYLMNKVPTIFRFGQFISLWRGDLIHRCCPSVCRSVLDFEFFKKRGFKSNIATCLIQPSLYYLIFSHGGHRRRNLNSNAQAFIAWFPSPRGNLRGYECMYWFKTLGAKRRLYKNPELVEI